MRVLNVFDRSVRHACVRFSRRTRSARRRQQQSESQRQRPPHSDQRLMLPGNFASTSLIRFANVVVWPPANSRPTGLFSGVFVTISDPESPDRLNEPLSPRIAICPTNRATPLG